MSAGRWGLTAQTLALLAFTAVLGTAAQWWSPTRIPWREDWSHFVQAKALKAGLTLATVEETAALLQAGQHLVLDARPLSDYEAGRLPGALSLPQTKLDDSYPQISPLLSPAQPLLVYCTGHECDESYELCLFLRAQGFTNVVLFVGGFTDWKAAGLEVER